MAYDLVKTKYPGIFKRGDRYVVTWRDRGKQHRASFRTLAEAREAQGKRRQHGERKAFSRVTFEEYAKEWLRTYTGRTARGNPTDGTMVGYRRGLEQWAIPDLGHLRMGDIGRRDVRGLIRQMQDAGVTPATIRAHMVPVKALFACAVDDEDIRDNPASIKLGVGASLDMKQPKAMTREELALVLAALPDEWRPFFAFLAQTGLRISEAVAVTWDDLDGILALLLRLDRRESRPLSLPAPEVSSRLAHTSSDSATESIRARTFPVRPAAVDQRGSAQEVS